MKHVLWIATLIGLTVSPAALAEQGEPDEGLVFVGQGTLGANLYDISAPFNDSTVSGFFDQWRYIENKEDSPPFYVDLFHLNLGLQRPDQTYLTRFEYWSPNLLNERGTFDLGWRGVDLEANYRRRRGDLLRFFPTGTGEGSGYGSVYDPDTPNGKIFDANRRLFITRQGMDGTLALDFGDMGWGNPLLERVSLYGDYQSRTGYRQDSLLAPGQSFGDFQGDRRRVDQEVATLGGGLLVFPFQAFTAKLDVKQQDFTERAPQSVDFGFAVPNYVPDTSRLSARLDVSRRWAAANFTLGGFYTRLKQQSDETPVQAIGMLGQLSVESYSAWTSFDAELPSIFDLTGHAKWTHRQNSIDPDDFDAIQISSPYVSSTGVLKANFEIGARPQSGTRAALGYRAEYTDRSLHYKAGAFAITPDSSTINPDSLHHFFYFTARTRLARGLQLSGEVGYDWGVETSYPNEFESAVYFTGRGSYTLPIALPVVLSLSGAVIDGESPLYEFVGLSTSEAKTYDRMVWNYDATATVVPIRRLSVFATFAQRYDDQDFRQLRATNQRRLPFTDYFIDSDPDYRADIKSLTTGATLDVTKQIDVSAAASITWTHANFRGDAVTDDVLRQANEIDNRIIALESDLDYEPVEGLEFGIGYRWQQYQDSEVKEFLDYSGTVHTVTLRATVDFAALPRLLP